MSCKIKKDNSIPEDKETIAIKTVNCNIFTLERYTDKE